jgi:hypothetical protein
MRWSIAIMLLFFYPAGYGQNKPVVSNEKPFQPGERLTYSVKFGPIIAGTASLYLRQVTYNHMTVYHSVGEGKTLGVAERLYSVKDVFESYFDQNTGLPHKIVRDVKEGNYKKHEEAIIDHKSGTAYSVRLDTVMEVPADILDMISLIYYLRSINLNQLKYGDVIKTVTYFDDELFPFDLRYRGKEEIRTSHGKIRCHRFDPVVEPGRMFESEDDMTFWLSDDKNVIPIKVRFDLLVGSLKLELDKYSNLKYPLIYK